MTDYNVIKFPEKSGGGGDGPEDPMLDSRVTLLERSMERFGEKFDRVDEALRRIEDALKRLASDGADTRTEIRTESLETRKQLHELNINLIRLEGRAAAVEGRLLESKAALPTSLRHSK